MNIIKIADKIEKESNFEMYWDYRDNLTDEQVIKIITEEDGLNDVESDIYENNWDYISEIVIDRIKEYLDENNLTLTEEEQDELRMECEGRFDYNIKGLLNNSETKIRVELQSSYNMICFNEYRRGDFFKNIKKDFVVKEFMRVFKDKYDKKDFEEELNNVFDYGNFTFYFKVKGQDILTLREQILNGFIELREGLNFGLFDNFNGSGSLLEMKLLDKIKLNLKDWRFKNKKEEIIENLKEEKGDYGYWNVGIVEDESKYGIQEAYGLTGESWEDFC